MYISFLDWSLLNGLNSIKNMTEKNILYKLLAFLTSAGLAVSGYFINQNFKRLDNLDAAVYELRINHERTTSNRFSSNDWVLNKALLDADRMALDKRVIRLEESIPAIRESLTEIKASIKELNK